MNKESLLEAAAEMERLEARRDTEELIIEAVRALGGVRGDFETDEGGWANARSEEACRVALSEMLDMGIENGVALGWIKSILISGKMDEEMRIWLKRKKSK